MIMNIRSKLVFFTIIFMSCVLHAQENEVSLANTDSAFIEIVTDLRTAVAKKEPFPIVRAISSNFKIERDFGGISNDNENSVVNFLMIFPLDGFEVREEYKDVGWEQLKSILSSNTVIKRSKTNLCMPQGQYMNDLILDELLCFTKSNSGTWRISSYVSAGD